MPNRIIKETINESRGLTRCTYFAQDLYKRLITYADDYGRFNADPQMMLARLYPRDFAIVSLDDISDGLIELAGVGKIAFFTSEPRPGVYGCFPNWNEHQRVRESKRRIPDPTDTKVNDWYLRRFVPMELKIEVVQCAGFKCQLCGKHIAACDDAARLVKMAAGLFHIEHVLPCAQGGRSTVENLRLVCPRCNQTRQRRFDFSEILEFADSGGEWPQVAAIRSDSPPNPIQSESKSESESKVRSNAREADASPSSAPSGGQTGRFCAPTAADVAAYCRDRGYSLNAEQFVDFYASKGWKVGNTPMKDWRAAVRTWARRNDKPGEPAGQKPKYAPLTGNPFSRKED